MTDISTLVARVRNCGLKRKRSRTNCPEVFCLQCQHPSYAHPWNWARMAKSCLDVIWKGSWVLWVSQRSLVSCCICDTVTMLFKTPQGANRVSRNKRVEEIPNFQDDTCNNHARSKLFSAVEARGFWSTCPFFKRNESKHIVVNSLPFCTVTDFGWGHRSRKHVILPAGHGADSKGSARLPYWETREFTATVERTRQGPSHMWLVYWRDHPIEWSVPRREEWICSAAYSCRGEAQKKKAWVVSKQTKIQKAQTCIAWETARRAKLPSRPHVPYSRIHYPKCLDGAHFHFSDGAMGWSEIHLSWKNRVQWLIIPMPRVNIGIHPESRTVRLRPYLLAHQITTQDNGRSYPMGRIVHNDSNTVHHVPNYFHSFGYPGSLAHAKPGIWSCVDISTTEYCSRQSYSKHRPKDPPKRKKMRIMYEATKSVARQARQQQ